MNRSIVGHVAALAMAAALITVAALYAVTWWVTAQASARSLAATVDTDLAGLADIHASGGRAELAARIGDRLALTGLDQRRAHYLLADAAGRPLAGDLKHWPALTAANSEAGYVTIDDRPLYARATALSPDLSIVVAREYAGDRSAMRRLTLAFAAAGAAIVVAVGLFASRLSRQLALRVTRINAAYREVGDKAAARALADDPGRDEIGELARHSAVALERLANLVDAQRHVSDNVAHEIRTPLMHLDGRLLGLFKTSGANGGGVALDRARADIRRIVGMLDSLLDIAASEARRGDSSGLAPFDLSELAIDLADVYRSSMEEAGLSFVTGINPGVTMLGEPMQITRLLSNLLDNAIKYVPAGRTVRLDLATDGTLVVEDDGPGIPAEARETMFDRFRRGTSSGQVGHGLGLALARAIAERHGLTLRLEDRSPGCRFVMTKEERA